jgi:hypothetical protein
MPLAIGWHHGSRYAGCQQAAAAAMQPQSPVVILIQLPPAMVELQHMVCAAVPATVLVNNL